MREEPKKGSTDMLWKRKIFDKSKEHSKLFHRSIRDELTEKEQNIRLRSSERKVIEADEDIFEEVNIKFQSVFMLENPKAP